MIDKQTGSYVDQYYNNDMKTLREMMKNRIKTNRSFMKNLHVVSSINNRDGEESPSSPFKLNDNSGRNSNQNYHGSGLSFTVTKPTQVNTSQPITHSSINQDLLNIINKQA